MTTGLPASPLVLDRDSTVPVHAQIASWLGTAIAQGELRPGRRLPGERELAQECGVSRMTLRQALAELESAGALVRVPGRGGGAFVAEPRIEVDLTHLSGLTDQLRRAGRRAGARVVSARRVVPERDVAAALGLAARAQAYEIVRVRSATGVPVALERSWLPARLVPGLIDRPLSGSLYAVLERVYGRRPVTAEEHLSPGLATSDEAEHLGLDPGAPVMRVERTAHDATGAAVEHARDVFRPDRVRFRVRRTPDDPTTLRAVT